MTSVVSVEATRRAVAAIAMVLFVVAGPAFCPPAVAQDVDRIWYSSGGPGEVDINLYYFWSETCPHCAKARPFIASMASELPWLKVESREVSRSADNRLAFAAMAASIGEEIRGVPAFFLCGRMIVGFDEPEGVGAYLRRLAEACHATLAEQPAVAMEQVPGSSDITVPLLGSVDPGAMSLPLVTVILGGLDAFNPCAFFVLLFLLSLLVHARSRRRMFMIGGIFVFFSGLIYFAFMAAWLNLFLVLEGVAVITTIAGAIAVVVAAINIKDYFFFRAGVSLSIPERAKPRLFARMRGLVSAESLPALVAGTVALAVAANTYELLCTSGFPLVYTRILTLNELPGVTHYLYLALYNAIYVLPLLTIVIVFTATLGARKLTEEQGRILKLLSGLMMLGLGLVLIASPDWLDNILTAVLLLIFAVAATVLLWFGERMVRRRAGAAKHS